MRDVSRGRHPLGGSHVTDLPAHVTVRELLRRRIQQEVAAYNADPGKVFEGLVQPTDSVRHSDGLHMRQPRRLDADGLVDAALDAVETGLLRLEVGGETVADLDREVAVDEHDEVVAVLERPVIAAAS